jgi:hypothetical protein
LQRRGRLGADVALDVFQRHAGYARKVNLFADIALHAEPSPACVARRLAAVSLRDGADLLSCPP